MRKNKDIPFETPDYFRWTDIPTGIFFTLALIALGLFIAINLRPLYYLTISWLDLPEATGLSAVVIKENYNALIDYCSPFFNGPLQFPSLRASESGLSHFAECKVIFNVIYATGLVSVVLCAISFFIKKRNGEIKYLRNASIIAVVLPLIVGLGSAINFDAVFILFHKLVFNNDDWLFDPVTDPIINLLPEFYFMECAIVICLTVLIGALISYLIYRSRKGKRKEVRLLPLQKNYYY